MTVPSIPNADELYEIVDDAMRSNASAQMLDTWEILSGWLQGYVKRVEFAQRWADAKIARSVESIPQHETWGNAIANKILEEE